jgi:hypothetical protein
MSHTPPSFRQPNGADRAGEAWQAILPVPDSAIAPTFRHGTYGEPARTWTYKDATGAVLFYTARFDLADGGKQILPRTFGMLGETLGWCWRAAPAPRALYRLPELAAAPGRPVVVVEGEKTADVAATLLPDHVVVTWPGGSKAGQLADLSVLEGRNVVLWPDHDAPGREAAKQIGDILLEIAESVRIVDVPADLPEGWDLADDIPDGLEVLELIEAAEPHVDRADRLVEDSQDDPGAAFEPDTVDFLARLKKKDKAEFERVRGRLKQAKVRVSALDEEIEAKRAEKVKAPPPPPDIAALAESAADIIASTNVLELFVTTVDPVVAGEQANLKILYLTGTSRLFLRVMSAAVKGPSSAGKSEIRRRVVEYFPPEDVVSFTTLSEKALLYYEGDFVHKIFSMGEASGAEEQSLQDYLLRELISEGVLRYPVTQKVGNEMKTVTVEKHGPVAFLVTTTQHSLHPEVETRLLSLEADDTTAQTRLVLRKVAAVEGMNVGEQEAADLERWRDFQRWLAAGPKVVVVPFADALATLMSAKAVRLRRDIGQLIRAIKTHALLHRAHRARDHGEIVATIADDYAPVRELLDGVMAHTAGLEISSSIKATVAAVAKLTGTATAQTGVTASQVGKELDLDTSATWRRLQAAVAGGHLINLETRPRQPGRYVVSQDTLEAAQLLPTPEELERMYSGGAPSETVQTCNRNQFGEEEQGVSVCKADANGVQTAANGAQTATDCNPDCTDCSGLQTPVQTVNPCSASENADRLHDCSDSEGVAGDTTAPAAPRPKRRRIRGADTTPTTEELPE